MIVLLKVLAAFCAADNTLEKNPEPGVGGTAFSGVGVRGADTIWESLLGPMLVAEPDLALLCDIMLPDGDTTTLGLVVVELFLEGDVSTGVGGVLTISGPAGSEVGGVCGRTDTTRGGWLFLLRPRGAGSGSCVSGCEAAAEPGRRSKLTEAPSRPLVSSTRLSVLIEAPTFFLLFKASLILAAGDLERREDESEGGCRAVLPVGNV